jgi:E3 ubiquitin-protein ligase BRE1
MQRLKTQVEEKERRNNRLQDELMRTKATEQMQVERVMAMERKQHEFERLRLEQQTQIKEMQEVINMLKTQSTALAQAKAEAEEDASVEARRAHHALRTTEEATLKLEGAQNKANTLTRRAEELGKELDTVEKARFSLQEQVSGLTGRLQKAQTKLEASSEGAGKGQGGAAGAGPVVGAVGGKNAAQNETLLKLLNCSVCNVRWKDCVITKCYHLFCQQCIQTNLKVRSRKCPACGKHFSENDVKPIFLT